SSPEHLPGFRPGFWPARSGLSIQNRRAKVGSDPYRTRVQMLEGRCLMGAAGGGNRTILVAAAAVRKLVSRGRGEEKRGKCLKSSNLTIFKTMHVSFSNLVF